MKNKNRILLISLGCIAVGIVLLIVGMLLGGHPGFYIDRAGLHPLSKNGPLVKEKTELTEFSSIDIELNYSDLEIIPSDGYYIEYQLDGSNPEPVMEVKKQKLCLKEKSFNHGMGFNIFTIGNFGTDEVYDYYVKLYVPADEYFNHVRLRSDDGRINTGDISAETMDITNDYGNVEMKSFKGKTFKVSLDDGDFKIEYLEAETINIDNSYGKSVLSDVKSQNLTANLDDGDIIIGKSNIGNLRVDNDYGLVNIGLTEEMDYYDFDLETDYGNIEIPGYPEISIGGDDEKHFKSNNNADYKIKVRCDDGDIIITEAK